MGGKRKVKEEFIGEKDNGDKEIKPMKGKNKCKVYDSDSGVGGKEGLMAHNELEGEVIAETGYTQFLKAVKSLQEKAESEQQQKLFGLALSVKRGETPRSEVSAEVLKIVDTMSEKKIRDFAKTKHEGLPEKVREEMECGSDDDQKKKKNNIDPRQIKTIRNRLRTKLGLMGLRMSYEPEGDLVDEATRAAREGVPETHRPGLEVNRRIATQDRETPQGRRILASQAASRRKKQTPEEQEKARKKEEELKKVQRINARPRTKKEIEMSNAIRNAGSLGS